MKAPRKPISAKTRYKVLERDEYTCQSCGAKAPHVTLQIDHVKPLARGGDDQIENLKALCVTCNLGKSDAEVSVAKVEQSLEPGKHPLIGWAFLSYRRQEDGGQVKQVCEFQANIRDVVKTPTEDYAVVDYFEWMVGEYTHSALIPIKEFSAPPEAERIYKLFSSPQDRNDYYEWKHGVRGIYD